MTMDKDNPKPNDSLVSLPGRALTAAIANLAKLAPSQPGALDTSVQASAGSVAIAGENTGLIVNVNATNLTIAVERQIGLELPSYLSKVVSRFSEDVSEYDSGPNTVRLV